jgi:hypothetical protein
VRTVTLTLIGVFIVLAGCCSYFNPTPTACKTPYIGDGAVGCCMDLNNDGVCDGSETGNYTCPDGSVASDASHCPTTITCSDGTVVYNAADCPSGPITEPGYYVCNDINESPCDFFTSAYCDKFDPKDINVRIAAADAIKSHPGTYSVNQLIDIYDWVRNNVFYQNVPLDMSAPYYPNETLQTKSGDCKNQAVLIASMVEAIGGSARVVLIPDCHHAFAEVYMGSDNNSKAVFDAIRAHYPDAYNASLHYHYFTLDNGTRQLWLIFDTAGAWYPGATIEDCLNASQTFEVDNCNSSNTLQEPQTAGTEYGPWTLLDDSQIIQPGWFQGHDVGGPQVGDYQYCVYNISINSLSGPVDWYVTDDENAYQAYADGNSFSYYKNCAGNWVQNGNCAVYKSDPGDIYLLLHDPNARIQATVARMITARCYGK